MNLLINVTIHQELFGYPTIDTMLRKYIKPVISGLFPVFHGPQKSQYIEPHTTQFPSFHDIRLGDVFHPPGHRRRREDALENGGW